MLAAVVLAATLAASAPAAGAVTVAEPCAGVNQDSVVAYLDTGDRLSQSASLYPGTELTVYVCDSGTPETYSAWELQNNPGFAITEERRLSAVVTVQPADGPVRLGRALRFKDALPGGRYTVVTGARADSAVGNRTLSFPSGAAKTQFVQDEAAFVEANDRVMDAAETLQARAKNGSLGASKPNESLTTLQSVSLNASAAAAQQSAFAATRAGDTADAGEVIAAVERQNADAHKSARSALQAYLGALQETRRGAARLVRLVAVGALLVGAAVGGGAGYWLARRELSKTEFDRGVSRTSQFSPKQIAVPVGLGVVALIVGAAVPVVASSLLTVIL
ncbi:hypothetical protein [Halobaculum sp. P14]|uniref:hypothetical protein n=1 Tax=Halobaculum sp. P14 TaxID=3421638 RepID=UPI003EB998B0